ncbi:helix-turn-helix domain-containing protein [Haladaptatus sp. DYF46]|uniref:MarR family transcriptional regulator n=1 Tax=Haladaptatus sp. DYF46 TaxID=2886041 RepID=UPI001E46C61B|nr:helix-turn-helix domain-containing protein [Haladaptatus sp. DYF46]
MSCPSALEKLSDLTPSAKLVAKVLQHNGLLTQPELAEETFLPQRTIRSALTQLQEQDLVDSRPSVIDARQQCYRLTFEWK